MGLRSEYITVQITVAYVIQVTMMMVLTSYVNLVTTPVLNVLMLILAVVVL